MGYRLVTEAMPDWMGGINWQSYRVMTSHECSREKAHMNPETPLPPAEARLIRIAREATGMTAADAARSTNGILSPAYWRDIERGYGGRRGQRVPSRASDRVLAHMARTVGVSPERLEEAGRAGAAEVLREALRAIDPAEAELMRLVRENPDDEVLRLIATRGGASAKTRLSEATQWLDTRERNGRAG